MATKEQGMPFFRDFFESMEDMSNEDKGILVTAMCEYFFNSTEPDGLTGTPKAVWVYIRRSLDTSKELHQARRNAAKRSHESRSKAAKESACPATDQQTDCTTDADDVQEDSKSDANTLQTSANGVQIGCKSTASVQQTSANKNKNKDQDQEQEREGAFAPPSPVPKKRFTPPSVEDVIEYATEKQLDPSQAQDFCDYYGSIGWVIGRNKPMKSWELAYQRWLRKQDEFAAQRQTEFKQPLRKWDDVPVTRVEDDWLEGYDLGN